MSASHSLNGHPHPSSTHTANRDHYDENPPHHFGHRFDYPVGHPYHFSQPNSPYPDSYFDEAIAYRSSPSPPPNCLDIDNLLNPTEPSYLPFGPFGYRHRASPSAGRPRSPLLPHLAQDRSPMPPARERPSRLPNGYVDLTSARDASPDVEVVAQRRKRSTPTPGPSAKRLRRDDGIALKRESETPETKIEEIDLSDGKTTVHDIRQRQRADAAKAQQKPEEKPTRFNTFTCVICMDTPTDITATSCGHLFCHTCLMEALIAGENRSGPNEPKRSQCPVCRKFINRTKAADIIPLLMKKGLATQPRKSTTSASKRQTRNKVPSTKASSAKASSTKASSTKASSKKAPSTKRTAFRHFPYEV